MEKLQLDTKGMHLIDGTDAFQQVEPGFPGESEDQMDDKGKPSGMELCCSIINTEVGYPRRILAAVWS